MSYCRWSSDDWQCDVYVYEDYTGPWVTHVAARRFEFTTPLPEPVDFATDAKAWFKRGQYLIGMYGEPEHGHWVSLPKQHAGARYEDDTPGACADRLEQLRAAGFNVPQRAIDALREEQGDAS